MFSFFLAPFIALALTSTSFVAADEEVTGTNTTLLLSQFRTEERFDRMVGRVFNRLDKNKSDQIALSDLTNATQQQQKNNKLLSALLKNPEELQTYLVSHDENKDDKMSKEEFTAALKDVYNIPVLANANICRKVRTEMASCGRFFYVQHQVVLRSVYRTCTTGLSSLKDFPRERCIMGVVNSENYTRGFDSSCNAIQECVNRDFPNRAEYQQATVNSLYWSKITLIGYIGFFCAMALFPLVFLGVPGIIAYALVELGFFIMEFVGVGKFEAVYRDVVNTIPSFKEVFEASKSKEGDKDKKNEEKQPPPVIDLTDDETAFDLLEPTQTLNHKSA